MTRRQYHGHLHDRARRRGGRTRSAPSPYRHAGGWSMSERSISPRSSRAPTSSRCGSPPPAWGQAVVTKAALQRALDAAAWEQKRGRDARRGGALPDRGRIPRPARTWRRASGRGTSSSSGAVRSDALGAPVTRGSRRFLEREVDTRSGSTRSVDERPALDRGPHLHPLRGARRHPAARSFRSKPTGWRARFRTIPILDAELSATALSDKSFPAARIRDLELLRTR